MKTIGIAAHSAEGGALCFVTACREGQRLLKPHMHPDIVVSAIPMGLSMPGWEADDHEAVAKHVRKGVELIAKAGADFYICPDNTAHIVLEQIADALPIPGLHIADVVAHEMRTRGWTMAGLLGTKWTMNGPVYRNALRKIGLHVQSPGADHQQEINRAIFEELCQDRFLPDTTARFIDAIADLRAAGADCAILGCTEIPLIINDANSPLPVLDSTRLLASYAVREAIADRSLSTAGGWITLGQVEVS